MTTSPTTLDLAENQTGFSDEQLTVLQVINADLTEAPASAWELFHHHCRRSGLDPFVGQIRMFRRRDGYGLPYWSVETGIDGYRVAAQRAAARASFRLSYEDTLWFDDDGHPHRVWKNLTTPPLAAQVTVCVDGARFPGLAHFAEYAPTEQDPKTGEATLRGLWSKQPAGSIARCAEALSLRRAFPSDLGGLYVKEEMQQAANRSGQPAIDAADAAIRLRAASLQLAGLAPGQSDAPATEAAGGEAAASETDVWPEWQQTYAQEREWRRCRETAQDLGLGYAVVAAVAEDLGGPVTEMHARQLKALARTLRERHRPALKPSVRREAGARR